MGEINPKCIQLLCVITTMNLNRISLSRVMYPNVTDLAWVSKIIKIDDGKLNLGPGPI